MPTIYTQRSYTESDRTKAAGKKLTDHENARPGPYESAWMNALNEAMEAILNRPAFQYDPAADPLYRQQKDNYVNLGRMAMLDTMGAASQLTGGYGNSYAQMAGQQAYQSQLQNLNNVIPELYGLALDAYDRRGQALMTNYGLLYDRDALDYSRYQDGYGQWQDQRDYLAGRYDTERSYDYTSYRDLVGDDQWKAAFDEDIRRFDFANKLGEFAITPILGVGGGSSGGRTTRKSKTEDEEGKKSSEATPASGPYLPKIVVPSRVNPNRYTHESY